MYGLLFLDKLNGRRSVSVDGKKKKKNQKSPFLSNYSKTSQRFFFLPPHRSWFLKETEKVHILLDKKVPFFAYWLLLSFFVWNHRDWLIFLVFITDPPAFPSIISKVAVDPSSTVPTKIECVVESNPPPTFSWTRNQRQLISNNGHQSVQPSENVNGQDGEVYRSVLVLDHATDDDLGEYNCLATNLIGKQDRTFLLVRPTVPDAPARSEAERSRLQRRHAAVGITGSMEARRSGWRWSWPSPTSRCRISRWSRRMLRRAGLWGFHRRPSIVSGSVRRINWVRAPGRVRWLWWRRWRNRFWRRIFHGRRRWRMMRRRVLWTLRVRLLLR